MKVLTVADEVITRYGHARNGSTPLWAFGSRTIARHEEYVYAVVPEIGRDIKPFCNTRWTLWRRPDGGRWEKTYISPAFNEREPCLLVRLPNGQLLVSTNPAHHLNYTNPDGSMAWFCQPQLVYFDLSQPHKPSRTLSPCWDKPYSFTEHSYRALAADADSGNVFLGHQISSGGTYDLAWIFFDSHGQTLRQGKLLFPMRGCYQQVAVHGNSVSIMAISDEAEPNQDWQAFKQELTGQHWDYDFRQLYFTHSPDLLREQFPPIATVASCDSTAGLIRNLDLWMDSNGDAHLLFIERNVWVYAMRDRFFPGLPLTQKLQYARVRQGRVISRQTLAEVIEDMNAPRPILPSKLGDWGDHYRVDPLWTNAQPKPIWATFHTAADMSLHVLYTLESDNEEQLWIRQIHPTPSAPEWIALQRPLGCFNAASTRNGCVPSNIIDIVGYTGGIKQLPCDEDVIRYVQIRIEP